MNYSNRVKVALDRLVLAVRSQTDSPITSLIVYGAHAAGNARPADPVSVAVVLGDTSRAALASVSPALLSARREAGVEPFLLHRDEIERICDVFPLRILEFQAAADVLFGSNPFEALEVDDAHLRLRVEQELRNHAIRLRRQCLVFGSDPHELMRVIDNSIRPLSIHWAALLRLKKESISLAAPASEVLAMAGSYFDLPTESVRTLSEWITSRATAESTTPPGQRDLSKVDSTFDALVLLTERAALIADRMEAGK